MEKTDIAGNISRIKAGLPPSVRLVAVSKFHPAESVEEAFRAGQVLFGENRVQEAAAKFDELRARGIEPELHIIGSLQRNKVKEAVRIASCIQSVDRMDLLSEIEKRCAQLGKAVDVLLEIKTGEETKSGFTSGNDVRAALSALSAGEFPHVTVRGFMTMAPNTDDEKAVRDAFASVRRLRDSMAAEFPGLDLGELSMGMSGDYRIAVEEGSTMVRIGTAIFGERDYGEGA